MILKKAAQIAKISQREKYTPNKQREENMTTYQEKWHLINEVFTPSKPINIKEFFAGRSEKIEKSTNTIFEKGCHLIIYGDRGVGKTSLANILKVIITGTEENPTNIHCTYKACNEYESFEGLWYKSLNELTTTIKKEQNNLGFDAKNETEDIRIGLGDILKSRINGEIEISDICNFLNSYNERFVFIFDEFDRLVNKEVRAKFSYLLKMLSDTNEKVTIILVGIAQDIHTIIENHESVERCLKQIYIPRMEEEELRQIIEKGIEHTKIECEEIVKTKIINFSEGFPQYVHLLCKYAANKTIQRESNLIIEEDLKSSITEAIENIQGSIKEKYRLGVKVISNNKSNKFKPVLFACAFVKTDEYGNFTSKDIQSLLCEIIGHEMSIKQYGYHLSQLCTKERGEILQKLDTSSQYSYKFKNPLLKAYIKIKAYEEGIEK